MSLVPLNVDTIQLGQPLPFSLRGADGVLLAKKGYVIATRDELKALVERGVQLCVDTAESGDSHRAYLAELQRMLISDQALGQIASVKLSAGQSVVERRAARAVTEWPEFQWRATQLLRAPGSADFLDRFAAVHEELARNCDQQPDATLLALVSLTTQETRQYSATHAMLVASACRITAREVLRWPTEQTDQLGRAALAMNISMTDLQDQLTQQTQPLTAAQIAAIEDHPARSEALLISLGMTDPVVLQAVRNHHHRLPGPLAEKPLADQMARLIQRADVFSARLAPRASRWPMPVTAAMQASYYDEDKQVDEAGAALIKALGIYPPGAFVRLASQEVGVVLHRGPTATTPRVAVFLNRNGMPTGELIRRDTTQTQWKITGAVAKKDLRVQVPLERLLPLV